MTGKPLNGTVWKWIAGVLAALVITMVGGAIGSAVSLGQVQETLSQIDEREREVETQVGVLDARLTAIEREALQRLARVEATQLEILRELRSR